MLMRNRFACYVLDQIVPQLLVHWVTITFLHFDNENNGQRRQDTRPIGNKNLCASIKHLKVDYCDELAKMIAFRKHLGNQLHFVIAFKNWRPSLHGSQLVSFLLRQLPQNLLLARIWVTNHTSSFWLPYGLLVLPTLLP